jgi:hypothetical protein
MYLVDSVARRLTPMVATRYPTEDELQRYLADYADLIPGDQIDPESPRRWLLVGREVGVPASEGDSDRWSLDHLFLDQDGIPTFVECKRAVDTRTRREVVAQMLDYAANGLAYWSIERIQRAASETARRRGLDLDALLLELLCGAPEEQASNFWDKVHTNLREQRVRLIFVVDEAPQELRRLVEFLNQKLTDVDVLIVEIKQYQGGELTVLSPRVLGMTEAARIRKTSTSTRKPRLTLEEYLGRATPPEAEVARYTLEAAQERRYQITWGATSFAVSTSDPRTGDKLGFVYAYITHIDFYFGGLPFSESDSEAFRSELLSTGWFRKSGKLTLRGVDIDDHNQAPIESTISHIFDRMDALVAELAAKHAIT